MENSTFEADPLPQHSLLPSAREASSSITFLSAVVWFALWTCFRVMDWLLLRVPPVIFKALATQYQFLLPASTIIFVLLLSLTALVLIVRHRYLHGYSNNTRAPQSSAPSQARNPMADALPQKQPEKRASSNYLDEFLSALKVFGYLERPVFHELTKNMTTQRLAPGEILYLDETLGFSVVVEGTLQVYNKVTQDSEMINPAARVLLDTDLNFEKGDSLLIGNQRYQLLNELKSGSPLSSLVSTLNLFNTQVAHLAVASPDLSPIAVPALPLFPDIVARPKPVTEHTITNRREGATIAIIPQSAFQRLHVKYPKATSHIVTMVLTRLYKVTMNTVHNYLGLTREILESEIKLNSNWVSVLPRYLRDGVVDRTRKCINQNRAPPHLTRQVLVSMRLVSPVPSNSSTTDPSNPSVPSFNRSTSRYVVLDSRNKASHPGDLLSSVPLSRKQQTDHEPISNPVQIPDISVLDPIREHQRHASLPRDHPRKSLLARASTSSVHSPMTFSTSTDETEDETLRVAIVENIFKMLGIDQSNSMRPRPDSTVSSSTNSSNHSSRLGLSSFMSGDNNGSDQRLGPRGYFDFGMSRPMAPVFTAKGSPHIKVYNTVSSDSEAGHNFEPSTNVGERVSHKKNSMTGMEFESIVQAFAQVLDIKYIEPDTTIVEQGSFNSGLYYIIHGSLDVFYSPSASRDCISSSQDPPVSKKLYTINEGGIAGYLTSVLGFRSLLSFKTPQNQGTVVAHIRKKDYSKLMDTYYPLLLPVASRLAFLLSHKVLTIDFALEWCHIPAGNILCSQGDLANGFHIVLSGRFREVRRREPPLNDMNFDSANRRALKNKKNDVMDDLQVLSEYGHGASIGEVEVLTASRRTSSLVAIRDSETARIPRTLFEMLSLQNPSLMVKVSRIVASKFMAKEESQRQAPQGAIVASHTLPYISNDYKTITIMPAVGGLAVREFAEKLVHSLKSIGRNVIALDQASTLIHLGRHAFDERLSQLKLSGYFAYLEEEYETIVYVCDTPVKSNWTSTCISQGDCILLLADADDYSVATGIGDYEHLLVRLKTTARTDLCLIHPDRYVLSGSTSVWLKNRVWVHGHHHIQMKLAQTNDNEQVKKKPNLIVDFATKLGQKTNPNLKLKIENVTNAMSSFANLNARIKKREHDPLALAQPHKDDFLRLARILSNEAIGLVLGGGGSRGISHIGVVAALEKHGLPVDLIGGTSIGSFVGGLYAKEYNSVSIYGRSKMFSKRVASMWRSILDLTYPVTSYITGYEFNRGIWKVFGSSEIEDFWIKYYCNSTNITNSTMDIHETGYAWRFIRASMSLAGLLPPIAFNGCMLLDGGYIDNLPVTEMKKKGAKHIIAVDVGSADDKTPMNYGDTLLGFWVLFNRWNPFSKHPNVPNMMDIQMRLAYVASVNALEHAKKMPGVIYLRPPIDDYATLDFGKFDEIFNVGLAYADKLFDELKKQKKLPSIAGIAEKRRSSNAEAYSLYRRNSI